MASISTVKKITKPILLVLVFFMALPVFAQIKTISPEESIPLYEVVITPNPDATFSVEEIIYYDFARNYKHGITRTIPIKHPQESSAFYKHRGSEITIQSVTKDDEEIVYEATEVGDNLFIKVGDPSQTITSEHKFSLKYEVAGGLQYFTDGPAELYWNAIGADSSVEILKGIITVKDEHGLLTGISSCYVGAVGANENCGEVEKNDSSYTYTTDNLGKYTGVTIAFALNDSVPTVIIETFNYWYLVIPAVILILLAFATFIYRYRTKFRTGKPIIAQYEPYENFKPMYTGVLFDDVLHPADITACIVYLAEQGYLKIVKTTRKFLLVIEVDDYEVILKKIPGEELTRFQRDVLSLLFSNLSEGEKIRLSKLSTDYSKQRENHKVINQLKSDLKKDLADEGFFQNLGWEQAKPLLAFGIGLTAVSVFLFPPIGIIFVILGVIFLLVSRRRTRKGYEALDHLKGFKDFLSTTDKERYKFHNSPKQSPEQFMQYLPYAIAFGVEEEWAEVFKGVTIPDPEWYDAGNAGSFSALNLTSSLSAFSTAFASSSGSGSSGGAGGGGSVGGGGGGGSVGSW